MVISKVEYMDLMKSQRPSAGVWQKHMKAFAIFYNMQIPKNKYVMYK